MSDVAIRYIGALIFFCQFEKKHGYCLQGGYFLVKYKFINQKLFFVFIFAFTPFEISPKYTYIKQILHYLDGKTFL